MTGENFNSAKIFWNVRADFKCSSKIFTATDRTLEKKKRPDLESTHEYLIRTEALRTEKNSLEKDPVNKHFI